MPCPQEIDCHVKEHKQVTVSLFQSSSTTQQGTVFRVMICYLLCFYRDHCRCL